MTRMTATVLTEFLLARIAEDEYAFRWLSTDGPPGVFIQNVKVDGRRLLAECEAKRRIMEALEDERQRKDIYNRDYPLGLLTTEDDLRARLSVNARWAGLEVAARALAAVYADHPDYRDEWKP